MSEVLTNPYSFGVSQHYSTDFSTHGDWSANTTNLNIGSNKLSFDLTNSSTDEFMNIDLSDLGINVSDTEWLLRYEFEFTTLNANDNDENNACFVGCYSHENPTTGESNVPSGDALRYGTQVNLGCANILDSVNGGVQTKSDVNNDPFSLSTSTGTTFYIETKRVSADLLEQRVYTNSAYTTQLVGSTTMSRSTSSAVNNTQFLTIQLFVSNVDGSGYTGFLNQLDFWNNSSVPF